MQLTKNFTLEELTTSATAAKYKLNNTPSDAVQRNLQKLASEILQPVRDALGSPIIVTSGYRSSAVNKAVGGASTSQHVKGEAADIKCSDNAKLFYLIKQMMETGKITVGQLIWEYGNKKQPQWIHVSLPYTKKNQVLYIGVK